MDVDLADPAEPRLLKMSFNLARYQHQGGNFAVPGYYRPGDNSPGLLLPTANGKNWSGKLSKSAERYAWRHNKKMNVAFFDGHVELRGVDATIQARLYVPKGSIIRLSGQTLDPVDTDKQVIE